MSARNYVFLSALLIILPLLLAFMFYNMYKDLKKKGTLKKIKKGNLTILYSSLGAIAVGVFIALYFATLRNLVLTAVLYFFSIYFILDKASKAILRRMTKKK